MSSLAFLAYIFLRQLKSNLNLQNLYYKFNYISVSRLSGQTRKNIKLVGDRLFKLNLLTSQIGIVVRLSELKLK